MCNNCNGGCPGLLNLLFGRTSNCGNQCGNCGCGNNNGNGASRTGNNGCGNCGCGNCCGNYDAYYAAQYALNSNCGCNTCGSGNSYSVFGAMGTNGNGGYGIATVSSCGCGARNNSCGCNSCNGCNFL